MILYIYNDLIPTDIDTIDKNICIARCIVDDYALITLLILFQFILSTRKI